MNVIIVGDGKVGATLVERLSGEGHNAVVIDRDQKIVEQMVNPFDVMGVCGNGAIINSPKPEKRQSNTELNWLLSFFFFVSTKY